MQTSLVMTIIGEDRPGLVNSLAGAISAHDGNWLESRMARLAGRFAGILRVAVAEDKVAALTRALLALEAEGLQLTIVADRADGLPQDRRVVVVELTGHDHPGIIHDVSHALAMNNVNIEELETRLSNAAMSGESLFQATARLGVPSDVSLDELRRILEALAQDLMVDTVVGEDDQSDLG